MPEEPNASNQTSDPSNPDQGVGPPPPPLAPPPPTPPSPPPNSPFDSAQGRQLTTPNSEPSPPSSEPSSPLPTPANLSPNSELPDASVGIPTPDERSGRRDRTQNLASPLGQGVKEIPEPPNPFGQIPNFIRPPAAQIPNAAKKETPDQPKTEEPKSENRMPPPRPPAVVEAIRASRKEAKARGRETRLIISLSFLIIILALILGVYFFIQSLKKAPVSDNEFNLDSLNAPATTPSSPLEPAATKASPKIRDENGFGPRPKLDLHLFELTGLTLSGTVVADEATLSASLSAWLTVKNGRAPVYFLAEAKGATPSAIFREGENEFTAAVANRDRSFYKIKNVADQILAVIAAPKVYGRPKTKVDWSKNSLKSLTLSFIDLAYVQNDAYLEPVFLMSTKGKLKSGLEVELWLLSGALE